MSLLDSLLSVDPRLSAAIKIGMGLINSGKEIFDLINSKDELTDEDLQAIIDRENAAQTKARDELRSLIGS